MHLKFILLSFRIQFVAVQMQRLLIETKLCWFLALCKGKVNKSFKSENKVREGQERELGWFFRLENLTLYFEGVGHGCFHFCLVYSILVHSLSFEKIKLIVYIFSSVFTLFLFIYFISFISCLTAASAVCLYISSLFTIHFFKSTSSIVVYKLQLIAVHRYVILLLPISYVFPL